MGQEGAETLNDLIYIFQRKWLQMTTLRQAEWLIQHEVLVRGDYHDTYPSKIKHAGAISGEYSIGPTPKPLMPLAVGGGVTLTFNMIRLLGDLL
ncbi:hypothetical protein BSKO_06791 [Bryopsis sp. KO-2023]|nr:hypothetical protein BSKO_06791 [Bryopsis sp. KO-2023]